MAIYVVYHGGNGSSGAAASLAPTSGEWATAYQTLGAAVAVATYGDWVLVAHDHAETLSAATTYAFPSGAGTRVRVVAINRSTSTPVSTYSAVITQGGANVAVTIVGRAFIHGLEVLGSTTGGTSSTINLATTNVPHHLTLSACRMATRVGGSLSSGINVGPAAANNNDEVLVELMQGSILAIGASSNTSNRILVRCRLVIGPGCAFTSARSSTVPGVFSGGNSMSTVVTADGADFSGYAADDIVASSASVSLIKVSAANCKFASGIGLLSAGTSVSNNAELWLSDCMIGSTPVAAAYATDCGSAISDTGVKYDGDDWSYKVTTTSLCGRDLPLVIPLAERYTLASVGAITPYAEILRNNDSTSAYTEGEVYGRAWAKTSSGDVLLAEVNDGPAINGSGTTNQGSGAGLGSWTGESGSCWSGRLTMPTVTPAEDGMVSMHIAVTAPNIAGKLHVSPRIRW